MKRWADHFWTEEAFPRWVNVSGRVPPIWESRHPGMALFTGDTRHAVWSHHHEDKITYVPQGPRQAYFRSYLQNCSNKYCLRTQRLPEVRYIPRRHQPPSEAECSAAVHLQNASKWLPQHAPVTGKHTQASRLFEGVGDLVLWIGYHVVWRGYNVFLQQHPLRASCSVKASSPLTLRA